MSGNGKQRQKLRNILRNAFGDSCYWCGNAMLFPDNPIGFNIFDPNMATIEHHYAKQKGDKNQILFLRLAHRGCNK